VAIGMSIEFVTRRNPFSIFGGVPAVVVIRDGRPRCNGAFSHPIMAGSFGAALVPVFVGMWFAFPRLRWVAQVGAISGVLITLASASSGPALALLVSLITWALWPLRRHTRALRWGLLLTATVLHFARDKPIWHLIGRASDVFGGEGYHRYRLIDAFVNHWSEWWLLGTRSTAHWGWILWDTTNQYVVEGISGGILTLAAFITVLSLAFRALGLARKAGVRMAPNRQPWAQGLWCWGLGASLTGQCASFISVSYFGQLQVILYLFLAVIAAELSFIGERHRAYPSKRPVQVHAASPVPDREPV